MAQVLQFPASVGFQPLRIESGRKHSVRVRVTDAKRPEEARWCAQHAVQRAASFFALDGFNDDAARNQIWHSFEVSRTFLIRRFLRDVEWLVTTGRIDVKVDGARVRIASLKAA
jgi:hypothetical protein